jgi:thioredoxin reductase (NADPH)
MSSLLTVRVAADAATPVRTEVAPFAEPQPSAEPASDDVRQLIIIGSGPAGYTAAIYAARASLRPLVIEGFLWGGQLMQTTEVENYPGFRSGIQGPELMAELRAQAAAFGAEFVTDDATRVELQTGGLGGGIKNVWVEKTLYRARTVIVATGAYPRKLGLPSEERLVGHGVSYCATCDAPFYRGKKVVIVGGGDSAFQEAIFLTRFADRVTLIHRRDAFSASPILVERARANPKIEILTDTIVSEILGEEKVTGIRTERSATWQEANMHATGTDGWRSPFGNLDCEGVFVAIGHIPNTALFEGQLQMDCQGYLATVPGCTMTIGAQGVYAAGDVAESRYQQAITAASSGCMAALDVLRHIEGGYTERDIFAEHDEEHSSGLDGDR